MLSAVVLAGGYKKGLTDDPEYTVAEPFIPVGKRYMIEYVVEALRGSSYIKRIIIAGPSAELGKLYKEVPEIKLVDGGQSTIGSFLNAFEMLQGETERILVVTADVPLLTVQAVNGFIESCLNREGDFFYPVTSKEANESRYPGVQRTYVKLKEGIFTGGNIMLINPLIVKQCIPVAEHLILLRKKPLRLATFLGWDLLVRYLLGELSIRDAEKRLSRLLGIQGHGIISPYPEIGIDVDKKSDLTLVTKSLAS